MFSKLFLTDCLCGNSGLQDCITYTGGDFFGEFECFAMHGFIDPEKHDEPLAEYAINPEAVGSVVSTQARCGCFWFTDLSDRVLVVYAQYTPYCVYARYTLSCSVHSVYVI